MTVSSKFNLLSELGSNNLMCSSNIIKFLIPLILIANLLTGCESSGGGSDTDDALNAASSSAGVSISQTVVQGRAVKGIITRGLVNAYAVENNNIDTSTTPIATSVTNQSGYFNLNLDAAPSTWVYIQITGFSSDPDNITQLLCDAESCGTFSAQDADENLAGQGLGDPIQYNDMFTVDGNFTLGTIIQISELETLSNLSITPLTHMLVAQLTSQNLEINAENIQRANDDIVTTFALSQGTNVRQLEAINLVDAVEVENASDDELLAALISSGFHNVLASNDDTLIDIAAVMQLIYLQEGNLGSGAAEEQSNQIQLAALFEAAESNASLAGVRNDIVETLTGLKEDALDNVASYLLTLTDTQGGAIILLSSLNIPCESGCEFEEGSTVTLAALPDSGYQFSSWEGDNCNQESFTETDTPLCSVVMDQSHQVQANFSELSGPSETYTLTQYVTLEGSTAVGSVSFPDQSFCDEICVKEFNASESVDISANTGSLATISWRLDGETVCANQTVCNITMDQNHVLITVFSTANESDQETIELNITINGTGEVSEQNLDINCTSSCTKEIPVGATVALEANPLAQGYQFSGWSGLCNSSGTCIQTLDSDSEITALFSEIADKILDIEIIGSGTVSSVSTNLSCSETCAEYLDIDAEITLTAIPATNFEFLGWTGNCISNPSPDQCTVKMSNHKQVQATFSQTYQSVTVTWQAPSLREDSSTLLLSEIKQYRIYYGEASGNYYSVPIDVTAVDGSVPLEFEVDSLEIGKTYYFAMKTIDTSERESDIFSDEVELTIN